MEASPEEGVKKGEYYGLTLPAIAFYEEEQNKLLLDQWRNEFDIAGFITT